MFICLVGLFNNLSIFSGIRPSQAMCQISMDFSDSQSEGSDDVYIPEGINTKESSVLGESIAIQKTKQVAPIPYEFPSMNIGNFSLIF